MMIKEMDCVSKVISKVYAIVDGYNTVVAEVVENCGCGFDYLIRIKPQYKNALPIFAKCMELCNIPDNEINIDYEYLKMSYDREYLYKHENIALMVDEIIE